MKSTVWILLSVAVIAGLYGCGSSDTNSSTKENSAVPVQVAKAQLGTVSEVYTFTGNIEPQRQVSVAPDFAGKVARIYVQEGDFVKRGQVLAELDTRATRLRLEQASAAVEVARANFDDASRNWQRMQQLHQKGTLAPQQFEKAQLGYEAVKAQLQQAKAALDLAEYQLDVSVMRAPFDGVIAGKYINEGETINPMMPGGRGVVTLMDMSKVKIGIKIPETLFRKIKKGMKAQVALDVYPDEVFRGTITTFTPAANPVARTFAAEIIVPNPHFKLRAGMFARVKIVAQKKTNVIVVLQESVLKDSVGKYVFVEKDGVAHRRSVQPGLQQADLVEISSGLQAGEKVVVLGQEMLKDGSPIVIRGGSTE